MNIRPAEMADIEAIERLTLQSFSRTFQASMGNCPLEKKLQVLVGLRRAQCRPVEGILAAVEGSTLAGMAAWQTAEMSTGYRSSRLSELSPLGLLGAGRFLLVALTVYVRYRPDPEEVYVHRVATSPTHRRRGVGLALLQQIEENSRQAGKTIARSLIAKQNLASRALFQKQGYQEVRTQRTYLRGWVLGEPEIIHVEKVLD